MTPTPAAAFRHDVADWVLSLPVAAAFGLSFDELTDGRAITRLQWRTEHSHTPGAFQASPIATLADFTGAAAAATLLSPGSSLATVDYTAKFLTEARGEQLLARGRVLRPGFTLTVASVDVYAVKNGSETFCAAALVTVRNFPAPLTQPAARAPAAAEQQT
jgi:uncharacterized protein (TIGR00369 family)